MKLNITKELININELLPSYGNRADSNIIWMEEMKLFKVNEYRSQAGHRYITGLRFSDQLIVAIKYAEWNQWTYINDLEIFTFDGKNPILLDKKNFKKEFYNEDMVREQVKIMVRNALESKAKTIGKEFSESELSGQIETVVNDTYRSFLKGAYPMDRIKIIARKSIGMGQTSISL